MVGQERGAPKSHSSGNAACKYVERICQEALEQPSRQAALRALRDSLGSLEEDGLPGLRNEGFLASHELATGVPERSDWSKAKGKAQPILSHTGKDLLKSLGFTIEPLDKVTDDWWEEMKRKNDGWGFQLPPKHTIEIGQEVYYTPDSGNHGHGGLGGTTLLSVDGDNCTIEITGLVPQWSEYDYGTKVHYGELDSSVTVQVPRKHIYHYSFTEDW